jgi:ferredoxin-NADP reductase
MPVTLSLIRKLHEGGNIWSFIFKPSSPLEWIAGQFIRVELPHVLPDEEGTKRYFTIASPPHDGVIQITTRITSSTFKQHLSALPEGGRLGVLDHPAGDFVWPQSSQPLIFAAQGIGITPFYSMLRARSHHHQPLAATLLYANLKHPIPFETTLRHWADTHPEFHLVLSDQPITAPSLQDLQPNLAASLIYVSGPGNLVQLLGPPYNVPGSQLKQDFFPNYTQATY